MFNLQFTYRGIPVPCNNLKRLNGQDIRQLCYIDEAMTFDQSESRCQAKNLRIATIDSDEAEKELKRVFRTSKTSSFWLKYFKTTPSKCTIYGSLSNFFVEKCQAKFYSLCEFIPSV